VKPIEGVPLAPLTTLGVGGRSRYFVEAQSEDAVLEAIDWAERHRLAVRVLGGGSNVVISDAGFAGLVVRVAMRGIDTQIVNQRVELSVAAGEPWDALVAYTVEQDLAGFECLSGIPGLAGATPIQNVGAYGQDVSETIAQVRALDRRQRAVVTLDAKRCRFSYRDSLFKSVEPDRYVVLSVTYRLRKGAAPTATYPELKRLLAERFRGRADLRSVRECVLEIRRSKSMVLDRLDSNARSCGSFFVNPIVDAEHAARIARLASDGTLPSWLAPDGRTKLSAAWLIEQAGFSKGQQLGSVGISSRHSLALVCHDGAEARDVVALARRIRARVAERFEIELVPEPVFWGFAHLEDGLPEEL